MFTICEEYFNDHRITISTNTDVKKSKTKCIYFSHNRSKEMPAPIMMGEVALPWVDSWAHLGNNLHRNNLSVQCHSTLDSDTRDKRIKFIGKYHSLRQEFGFLKPETLFKIIEIYATSFYGSNLWSFSSYEAERIFTSWNNMVRSVWNISNIAHRYLIEELSGTKHKKI